MFMERLGDASYRNARDAKSSAAQQFFRKRGKSQLLRFPAPTRIHEHRGLSLELFNPSLIDELRDAGCQCGEIVVFPRAIKLLGE